MSLGLAAPAAVSVEVRGPSRRVFRLTEELGPGGIRLGLPAPFEPGRPVEVRFTLPGSDTVIVLDAEVVHTGTREEDEGERGGLALHFLRTPEEARDAIISYVADRLGLPPLPPLP